MEFIITEEETYSDYTLFFALQDIPLFYMGHNPTHIITENPYYAQSVLHINKRCLDFISP